jgi:hypothetical protein
MTATPLTQLADAVTVRKCAHAVPDMTAPISNRHAVRLNIVSTVPFRVFIIFSFALTMPL